MVKRTMFKKIKDIIERLERIEGKLDRQYLVQEITVGNEKLRTVKREGVTAGVRISPITGKPVRKYRRRKNIAVKRG